jgi:hypothetical protein
MQHTTACSADAASFELRFDALFAFGRGFSFPCDAAGHVDLDALSDGARNNYLFARATIGRDLAWPRVSRLALQ